MPPKWMRPDEQVSKATGKCDFTDDIRNGVNRLKEERKISKHFDGAEVVWVELPRSLSGIASSKYLEWLPDNFVVILITIPDAKFTMCVPSELQAEFTTAALDKYQEAQQGVVGNGGKYR
jgi:hypothetical protein